ncbi:toprim domain-containing protein [Methylophaga sp. OBS1]|uniref:toprim domain-containing protein n=1 Tax=Methylophaga sp. OBS1 TaxID=2991933 RepID=UPI00224FB86E|nr:toprim domain-containing protein [Methylophaga sp. OBS1]MCX4192578.1 toprim domain-containing protein [Methylophaga sp. OBS1]
MMLMNSMGEHRCHGDLPKSGLQIDSWIEILRALSHIPADLPRDEWLKVTAAWKSAGGDFDTWNAWSSTGISYHPRDAKSVWNSLSVDGAIGLGTLFFFAKQYGYNAPTGTPNIFIPSTAINSNDTPKHEANLRARETAESILDDCEYATADHPYLKSKFIEPRLMPWRDKQNRLVLPVMDIAGDIHSLQFISEAGQKQFLAGGAITGHFYQIWSGNNAIVICEGYATGVTLYSHYTPDCSVVVAFNAGNLKPVAEVLRKAYPETRIIIAGDNDKSGAGQKAANEAALLVRAQVSIPTFLSHEAGSDWNDYWLNQLGEVAA